MARHLFYLTRVPSDADSKRLALLRDVRNAMRVVHPEASASLAQGCLDTAREKGYGILGFHDEDSAAANESREIVSIMQAILDDHDCMVVMDLDTERADKRHRERKAAEEGFTPEQVFAGKDLEPQDTPKPQGDGDPVYETAMLLVATLDGNPVQAAATAVNLGRVTGQQVFYGEVLGCLFRVFPWVEVPLRSSGLLP